MVLPNIFPSARRKLILLYVHFHYCQVKGTSYAVLNCFSTICGLKCEVPNTVTLHYPAWLEGMNHSNTFAGNKKIKPSLLYSGTQNPILEDWFY